MTKSVFINVCLVKILFSLVTDDSRQRLYRKNDSMNEIRTSFFEKQLLNTYRVSYLLVVPGLEC